jgi:phosphatidylinositol alpha-1,6-mannosyltransferase
VTLRTVVATLDLAPTHGGIQTMTAELARGATRLNIRLVAPSVRGHRAVDLAEGWSIRRVPGIGPGRRMHIPTLALAARRELSHADLGIAMHPNAALGFLGQRKPFIVVTHGGELRSPKIRRVARAVFPRAARVICNSRYTRSEAIALGADPLRCEVIPPGAPAPRDVPPERSAALRDRLGAKRIVLCVARLVPHKGQDALIEALTYLDDTHLVLIGTGPHEARLRALTQAKAVEGRITFAGRVAEDELAAWYAAADVFAMCSTSISAGETAGVEGAGIAILEAMSMKVPVVAAPTGGIPETVIDGTTGLLAPAEQPAAIARAIERIWRDEALRARIVEEAFRLVTTERSWSRFVQRIEDVCLLVTRRQP